MKKSFYRTNGALISLIIAIMMVLSPLSVNVAQAETNTKTQTTTSETSVTVTPEGTYFPPPFVVITDYPTGTNILDPDNIPAQREELATMVNHLETTKDVGIGEGLASRKDMNVCYYEANYSYVRPASGKYAHDPATHPNAIKATGSDTCNRILAWGRSMAPAIWLKKHHPELADRYIPLQYASYGNEKGNQYKNQATVIIMVSSDKISRTEFPGVIQTPGCTECEEPEIEFDLPPNCGVSYYWEENVAHVAMVCYQECTTTTETTSSQEKQCSWWNQYPCMTDDEKKWFWVTLGVGIAAAVVIGTGGACARGANGAGDAGICP